MSARVIIHPRNSVRQKRVLLCALFALCVSLSGCERPFEAGQLDNGVFELAAPSTVRNRSVNTDNLRPQVRFNDKRVDLNPSPTSDRWSGQVLVPEGEDLTIRVNWIERYRNRDLLLAAYEETFLNVSRNLNISLSDADYETEDFTRFPFLDLDNDRVPNLAERVEGSDPEVSTDPGLFRANAFIPAISADRAPIIDGSYDDVYGEAQFKDRDKELLAIDNRMRGFDPLRDDGDTEYRWAALHDERYLYIFVFGESSERRFSHGDSIDSWQDDTIDIYWDGDRSQGQTYDGVDDSHLMIPLLKLNQGVRNQSMLSDGTPDPSGRFEAGFNSIEIADGVEFANCVCPRHDIYELRLDLERLGIPVDRSFGFDVQLNDDRDGGDRDYKFSWAHPSAAQGVETFDETWKNPSRMGLIKLLPLNP